MTATQPPSGADEHGSSTRPYLIRALHEWCGDNGFTPYLAVFVTPQVQVPPEYVKNHEIVLNVGFDATSGLELGNEYIMFKARFGGVPRDIVVPVENVVAIYARENGQGMAFPMPQPGEGGAAAVPRRGKTAPALRLAPVGGDQVDASKPVGPTPPRAAGPSAAADARAEPGPVADATPADEGHAAEGPSDDEPTPPRRPALKRVK